MATKMVQPPHTETNYTITDFGAEIGASIDNTIKIQAVIDTCSERGGGVVLVPPGVYLTGTLFLRDNVILELSPGAELRAVESLEAFPPHEPSVVGNFNFFLRHALIVADGVRSIGIRGSGTLNVRGAAEAFKQTTWKIPDRYQNRPSAIRFIDCENVRVRDIQIQDAAFWTFHLMACRDVVVQGITLASRSPNYNCDGLDIDSCEDVRVSDCRINSQDDAISIKGTTARPCRRIMINNCILSSDCNAIRVGAENFNSFEDIHFSNLHIHDSQLGITFQNIDGYPMRRISFANISMRRISIPIHIITNRKTYPVGVPEEDYPIPHGEGPASIEGLVFDNIHGDEIGHYEGCAPINKMRTITRRYPMMFSGHPQAPIKGLYLRNITMSFIGGGEDKDRKYQPENLNDRPNPKDTAFPVYGLLLRHVRRATIDNVELTFVDGDARPAVGLEYVEQARLSRLLLEAPASGEAVGTFDCREVVVEDSYLLSSEGTFIPWASSPTALDERSEPFTLVTTPSP